MARKIQPIRNVLRNRLLEEAKERGVSEADADKIIKNMESDRPLIDWFINGGFEKLLQLFLELAKLFNATPEEDTQQS